MLITEKEKLKEFYTAKRLWQGIPGVEVTKGGRIFATFYSGGSKEQIGNFSLVVKSDDGENFSEPIAVAYKEGYRCYDPCLWIDPLNRLWFFWAYMPEHKTYCAICQDPDKEELIWGEPFEFGYDVMLNKPLVLKDKSWLFPFAVWKKGVRVLPFEEYDTKSTPTGAHVFKSTDCGKTISLYGTAIAPERCYDEHMVYEKEDGSLVMLIRTYYGIAKSVSLDGGKTWSEGKDSSLKGPNSRFNITKLKSGRVLLINHVNFEGRNNLTALLSEDDGETFKYSLLLDGRSNVSYPDVKEDENGNIYIIYDRERGCFLNDMDSVLSCAREILLSRITEEDIIKGELTSKGSYFKKIVSKLGEYSGRTDNIFLAGV